MTLQKSVAVRNAQLDALETAIGLSPVLRVRTGTMPANCAAADTGTVLATINLPSDWMAAASGGSKAKSGTWEDASADAGGLAGFWRLYDAAGTTCHLQGLVSQPWAASNAYVVGHQVSNGGNVYRATTAGTSAGSGGPTGTGSGITDGTAVWTYVGPVDMVLDNVSFAPGQGFTIGTFALTAGNA